MEDKYESIDTVDYVKKQPVWAFCLLSFCSFGLYPVYWFYRNWRFFKELYDMDIYPVWRAVFSVLFAHVLLERINDLAVEKGHPGISSNAYATGYVIVAIIQRILDRTLPVSLALFALLMPPFLFLIPSVRQLNYIYEQAHPNTYQPVFSPAEFVLLALGSTVMALAIAGSMMS